MGVSDIGGMIRGLFFANLKNKGLALLLALMVWWFAFNNTEDSESLNWSITIRSENPTETVVVSQVVTADPDGSSLGDSFDGRIQLTIRGQNQVIERILQSTSRNSPCLVGRTREVDLTNPDLYAFPKGVEVVTANPSRVQATVEERIVRSKPVRAYWIGKPEEPYVVRQNRISIDPPTVTVAGPASLVDQIESVTTATIRLDGQAGQYEEVVLLEAPENPLVDFEKSGPREVKVVFALEKDVLRRTLQVPLWFAAPPGYRVTTEASQPDLKVQFQGPPEALDEVQEMIKEQKLHAFVRVKLVPGPETSVESFDHTDLQFDRNVLPHTVEIIGCDPPGPKYDLTLERVQ